MQDARSEVIKVEQQYLEGAITTGERYNQIIAVWSEVTEKIADEMFGEMAELDRTGRSFNPVFIMAARGFEFYRHVRIPADEPPPPPTPPQPSEDDLDLDREIEYAFDTDETMGMRPPAGDVE